MELKLGCEGTSCGGSNKTPKRQQYELHLSPGARSEATESPWKNSRPPDYYDKIKMLLQQSLVMMEP